MWGGGRVKGARSERFFRFLGIFLFARLKGLGSIFCALAVESGREGVIGAGRIGAGTRKSPVRSRPIGGGPKAPSLDFASPDFPLAEVAGGDEGSMLIHRTQKSQVSQVEAGLAVRRRGFVAWQEAWHLGPSAEGMAEKFASSHNSQCYDSHGVEV